MQINNEFDMFDVLLEKAEKKEIDHDTKEVFEEAYTEVSLDTQLMREKVSEIISLVNKKANLFLPQSYLWMLLDELENNNFTFKKDNK